MTHFRGKLRLADVPESQVDAELQVVGDDIFVTSEARTIGHWKREELVASPHGDGFLLVVEGEELIFNTESEELILVLARTVTLEPPEVAGRSEVVAPPERALAPPVQHNPSPLPLGAPPRERRRAPKPLSEPLPSSLERVPPSMEPVPAPAASPRPGNHPMAVSALGFGVAGTALALIPRLVLVAVTSATLALVLGLFALYEIKKGAGRQGTDIATAGAALGAIALVMGMIVAAT